jgi:methanogenic corrinoid protein MtbC1
MTEGLIKLLKETFFPMDEFKRIYRGLQESGGIESSHDLCVFVETVDALLTAYRELKERREDEKWLFEQGMNIRVQVDETDVGNCFRVQMHERTSYTGYDWIDIGVGVTLHEAIKEAKKK